MLDSLYILLISVIKANVKHKSLNFLIKTEYYRIFMYNMYDHPLPVNKS